jgi:DNA topoisomerase I (EC 5.99.1.2)
MQLAQRLYEQGAITYMRTDSPNLSQEAIQAIRAYCEAKGWPLVETPRKWKSKEGAQEAHEAIRPTHIEIEEAGETADEKALYRLIRLRSLACQLEDAVYAVRTLQLGADMDGKQALFEAKGRTLLSQGWKILADQEDGTDEGSEEGEKEPHNPCSGHEARHKGHGANGNRHNEKDQARR